MGNLKSCFIVATLALAACGSDKAKPDAQVVLIDSRPIDTAPAIDAPPDAPAHDFSCLGQPLPTTGNATDTITVNAQVVDIQGTTPSIAPLNGGSVNLDMCRVGTNCNGQDHLTGTGTTDATGTATLAGINANSIAINGFVKVTHTGDRDNYTYLPAPIGKDQAMPVLTFTTTAFATANTFLQGGQQAQNGNLALAVTDCASVPISDTANVMLSVKQGGNAVTGTKTVDLGALQSQAAGTFIIFNVPPGATDVSATYMGMQLLTVPVNVTAGASTETVIRPGPLP
jgi:hypothetical protein